MHEWSAGEDKCGPNLYSFALRVRAQCNRRTQQSSRVFSTRNGTPRCPNLICYTISFFNYISYFGKIKILKNIILLQKTFYDKH